LVHDLEEEEVMQDKWAALLTNLADTQNKTATTQIYIQILNQLTKPEVVILDKLFKNDEFGKFKDYYQSKTHISEDIKVNKEDILIYSQNLQRLNLVELYSEKTHEKIYYDISTKKYEVKDNFNIFVGDEIRLTNFGYTFVKNCNL